jgi:hypothetical protein
LKIVKPAYSTFGKKFVKKIVYGAVCGAHPKMQVRLKPCLLCGKVSRCSACFAGFSMSRRGVVFLWGKRLWPEK